MPAPIILFIYNRPEHTARTLEALRLNDLAAESQLFVFADGAKAGATTDDLDRIIKTRECARACEGFKRVVVEEAEANRGLASSVIAGVTKIVNQFGRAIVVEDDIVTHPYFLRFMNEALDFYANDARIFMIGGYNIRLRLPRFYRKDVYIAHRSCSWGWATWQDRWAKADWEVSDWASFSDDTNAVKAFNRGGTDMFPMLRQQMAGKIDSWAIRWDYCMYKNDAYCLRPLRTLVQNIGCDGTGVHCGTQDISIRTAPTYSTRQYAIRLERGIRSSRTIERRFYEANSGIVAPRGIFLRAKTLVYRLLHHQ